ncbi:MAG: DUF4276 family protein [Acidobacteria bacterium]|nr:DUF4276 family protein [Acidobacteriota bacterium]MBI3658342.1 DUF4276 family protein [Acidobacteriota bacterium]
MVYVEGPSDTLAMEALLRPLLDKKKGEGVAIKFIQSPPGDKKKSLLRKVPIRAANILVNDPYSIVVAMPDLYPKDVIFPHETFDELRNGIFHNFEQALHRKINKADDRVKERFKVFCFKYDLEALVLASEKALQNRLKVDSLSVTWCIPVEDQNHERPPKRIVEAIFERHHQRYKNTADAPIILGRSNYQEIADRCSQCFKPFVEYLSSIRGSNI